MQALGVWHRRFARSIRAFRSVDRHVHRPPVHAVRTAVGRRIYQYERTRNRRPLNRQLSCFGQSNVISPSGNSGEF